MSQWPTYRGTYLNILLEMEGRTSSPKCSMCSTSHADIKCSDCFGANLFCKACCLEVHKRSPFHRTLGWTGNHYAPISLYSLGFLLCLGHNGEPCPKTVEVGSCKYPFTSCAQYHIRELKQLPQEGVGQNRQLPSHYHRCKRTYKISLNCQHQGRHHSQMIQPLPHPSPTLSMTFWTFH
jgi:hypothetical protein